MLLPILGGPLESCLGDLRVEPDGGPDGEPVLRYFDHCPAAVAGHGAAADARPARVAALPARLVAGRRDRAQLAAVLRHHHADRRPGGGPGRVRRHARGDRAAWWPRGWWTACGWTTPTGWPTRAATCAGSRRRPAAPGWWWRRSSRPARRCRRLGVRGDDRVRRAPAWSTGCSSTRRAATRSARSTRGCAAGSGDDCSAAPVRRGRRAGQAGDRRRVAAPPRCRGWPACSAPSAPDAHRTTRAPCSPKCSPRFPSTAPTCTRASCRPRRRRRRSRRRSTARGGACRAGCAGSPPR